MAKIKKDHKKSKGMGNKKKKGTGHKSSKKSGR
jgi:hypothetical protein